MSKSCQSLLYFFVTHASTPSCARPCQPDKTLAELERDYRFQNQLDVVEVVEEGVSGSALLAAAFVMEESGAAGADSVLEMEALLTCVC